MSGASSKFSVSIPTDLVAFLERYQKEHGLGSRSEVIARGLEKLREAELAGAYREHAKAWRHDPDKDFWDSAAVADGLDTDESRWAAGLPVLTLNEKEQQALEEALEEADREPGKVMSLEELKAELKAAISG